MRSTLHFVAAALLVAPCVAGCGVDSPMDDEADQSSQSDALGSTKDIDIGFNGAADQFGYFNDFFQAKGASKNPGPKLCHWYVPWNIALQGEGDPSSIRSLAYLKHWLHEAEGHCDEALISFQAITPASAPSQHDYKLAFSAFVETDWAAETGFTGSFAFTPWNEPNNPAGDGNGLGRVISPELAATYYLTAERECKSHGCKVAAGDFASNGGFWNDYEINCSSDIVQPKDLCKTHSSFNPSKAPASYLDRYKNYLVNHAEDYSLGASFRPKYFAFHGWHDINEYLNKGSHCSSYSDCVQRRLIQSLGGSWVNVELWDTETGVGQTEAHSKDEQRCGAAFLLRLTAIDARVTRIYLTRLHGGVGELFDGHTPRPAAKVLSAHSPTAGISCK